MRERKKRKKHIWTRKAVVARRYLRQGKAIRQVASPSSLCQRFPYSLFNAMVTKISKWSRIQDSCRITAKIESLAMPDIPSKFQKDPFITFWVILCTHRQTDKQTNKQTNKVWQKHYLLGGGNKLTKLSDQIVVIKSLWLRCVAMCGWLFASRGRAVAARTLCWLQL